MTFFKYCKLNPIFVVLNEKFVGLISLLVHYPFPVKHDNGEDLKVHLHFIFAERICITESITETRENTPKFAIPDAFV